MARTLDRRAGARAAPARRARPPDLARRRLPLTVHDVRIEENGNVIPCGDYGPTGDAGWVDVGIDHEGKTFAVRGIRRCWKATGKPAHPKGKSLLIAADGGRSNSPKRTLRRRELQKFASETGRSISAAHSPPGTSEWNKIEHRLFSYISAKWRGRPPTNLAVIISLIASTRTRTGLRVRTELDRGKYPLGVQVAEDDSRRSG